MQIKQKPNTLVCYICGREFGTKSLQIHLKSCQAKFQQEQALKQKPDRKILPPQPPLLRQLLNGNLQNLQIYNEQATQIHKYQVLPACRYCGRTFNEESLKVHVNVCTKKAGNEPQSKKMYQEEIKKPRTLACCVCGRQFGLTSLKIHYPQCIEKFANEQSKKPKQQRRKTPLFSQDQIDQFQNKVQWSNEEIESFNAKAMSIFREKGMIHCQICKRSFMPQPYQKHLRNCKQNNKNYQQPTVSQQYSGQTDVKKPKVLMCHICGREFGLSSLMIHQKTCQEKFINAEKLKPKSQRRPLPTLPGDVLANFSLENAEKWSLQKIEDYNKICNQVYRNQSMIECSVCKRKFIESAYQKHKGYCQKNNKPHQEEEIKKQPPKIQIQQAKQVKARQIKQIKVQNVIPQTAEQLEQTVVFQNLNHPAQKSSKLQQISNHSHRTTPETSEKEIKSQSIKQVQVKKMQTQKLQPQKQVAVMKNQSNLIQQSLELHPCEKCGRKFLAERLQKHISVCKGNKIIPNIKQKAGPKPKEESQNEVNYRSERIESKKQDEVGPQNHLKQLAPCSKCGRRFLQNRLAKHQQCCKGKQTSIIQPQNELKNERVRQSKQQVSQLFQKKNQKSLHVEEKGKQLASVDTAVKNNESFQIVELKACSKCERKFAIDRIQVHENICKGKPKLKMDPPEKAKTIEVIRKTKENFFKMVHDIKSKKIKEEQIDKQLDQELQTLGNLEPSNKPGLKNKKDNEVIQPNHDHIKKTAKQIDPENISKWKKNIRVKRSPEKQFKKEGRVQSHLPKI